MKTLLSIAVTFVVLSVTGSISADAQVVISQVYGGGQGGTAVYKNDYVELFNAGASAVSLAAYSIQYQAAGSTGNWSGKVTLSGTIQPSSYFLVQMSSNSGSGTGALNLPTPDVASTAVSMSASSAKVALVSSAATLSTAAGPPVTCPSSAAGVVDLVGYGTANCAEGTPVGVLDATKAAFRNGAGCTDTNSNSADFTIAAPAPRNSASPTHACTASSLSLTQLNPSSVTAGSSATTLTLTGTGFGSDSVVNFSGQAQIVPNAANISATSIQVTVPASYLSSAGFPSVSVTSGGITSNSLTLTISAVASCTETATIAQIQGAGDRSSYVSATNRYTSLGTVTYKKSNGFFMQMATGDGNVNTSDAIYVYTSSAPTVNLGDSVCVTGLVSEFYNGGSVILTDTDNTLTEYSSVTITTISTGNSLPAPITLNPDPAGAFDQLEKYEGMRVQVPSLTVTGPGGVSAVGDNAEADGTYSPSGAFWGVMTGTARPFREVGIDSSHPIYVENSTGADYGLLPPNVAVFDSNPERMQIYTGNPGDTVIDVSVGAVVTGISGVLDVYYGDFEVDEDPTTTPGYSAPAVSNNNLTYTAVPARSPSELTIATYNLQHFYDDQMNGVDTPFEIVLTTPTYHGRLAKVSMAIRNVLMTPDILAVQEAENLGVLQAMSAKISSDAVAAGQTDPQYAAYLVQGNDPSGINVGFLVNPNRVSNVSVTQYFASDAYSGSTLTFDRPPLLLAGTARNPGEAPLPVTVIANHLKALPDDDPTSFDATGTPEKRQAEAQELAQLIQNLQAGSPGIVLAVLGDLNSYEFNDGVNDMVGTLTGDTASSSQVIRPNTNVVSPRLTELSSAILPPNQRQSYTESGNVQQLDHILLSSAAVSRVTRFAIAHLDADFRESLHYDYTRPERLSDHDGEVSYLSLPSAADVTSSVKIAISGLLLNRATQLYTGSVTLTNTSAATIGSPVQLFFNGLPTGVTLANATGSQGGLLPYITSAESLAPGASVTIPVQFRVAAGARVSYTNNVYTGVL